MSNKQTNKKQPETKFWEKAIIVFLTEGKEEKYLWLDNNWMALLQTRTKKISKVSSWNQKLSQGKCSTKKFRMIPKYLT